MSNLWPNNPNFQDFATFLGLPAKKDARGTKWPYDANLSKKIEDLYVWGKIKSGSLEHEEIKTKVYELSREVGVNWIGKPLIHKLWQHVKFDSSTKLTEEEIEELEEKEKVVLEEKTATGSEIEMEKSTAEKPKKKLPATIKPIKQRDVTYRIKPLHEIEVKHIEVEEPLSIPIEDYD